MIVTIASGKGGTGKTTVATNLALSMNQRLPVSVVDCDVEEPNAALFLDPAIERSERVGILIPEIDETKCTHCGRCAEVCQYNAIAVIGESTLVFTELCHGCGSCTLNCPEGAISERLNPMGTIETGRAGDIAFGQGILDVGQAMATPVIKQLKEKAIPEATDEQLVIVDASPGTACPVVESMQGADVVLLVTEPTPFGLHDLRLAVQLAKDELGLPVGVVVNRDGVGDDGVDRFCAEEGIPIWMRIPMDRRIAEAYSEGQPMVEAIPEYREAFQGLYDTMAQAVAERGRGEVRS